MPRKIVLVSGSVASGKTALVDDLRNRFDNVHVVKTKHVIQQLAAKALNRELELERRAMQKFGERLDRETKGQWVRDALRRTLSQLGPAEREAVAVVDAVRIPQQISRIRESYGHLVVHIHLCAPEAVRKERYRGKSELKELRTLSQVSADPTEARIDSLQRIADIVIDTKLSLREDVLIRAAAALGLHSREYDRTVDVVVGGQLGSEGKGHIASYLAREYQVLVRVGGPNAGHRVFLAPSPYTHHQLPSGTLRNPLAQLVIAPGAVLNSEILMREIAECKVDSERLFIDPQAMIISNADIRKEKGLTQRISSTGQGVGEATARRIRDRGKGPMKLAHHIKELGPYIRPTWEVLEKAYSRGQKILLEGTQGTGLSLYHGVYPFVTSRDTSIGGCLSEAGISPSRVRKVVMVCRTYPIRVQNPPGGTSGPLSQEISWDIVSKRSGIPVKQLEKTEKTSTTNRDRRVGEFDWVLLRKASALNGPTDIALTFADYLDRRNEDARRYEQLRSDTIRFIEEVERVAAAPVSLISTRFDFRSVIDRRNWGKM